MDIIYKRPVVTFCIFMILGITAAFLSDSLILASGVFVLIAAGLLTIGGLRKKRRFVSGGILLFFLIGAVRLSIFNYRHLDAFTEFDGVEAGIKGYIVSEPEAGGGRVSCIVKVESIRKEYGGAFEKQNGKVLLSTLPEIGENVLRYGREVAFEGTVSLPTGVRNPGGFDYRRYLAQKGIGAVIFTYPYMIEAGEAERGSLLVKAGLKVRKRIVYVIENSLPRQQAGLLNGMLIGYREGLSEEVQEAFSDAGLTHIMAVSGANVAFLILPLAFILKRLRIRRTAANLLIIAFLIMFVFVTGFEASVLRAVIMACIILTAGILYREPDTYSAIALSCVVLIAINPYMLFNVGFQLSYAATVSIVMLSRNIKKLLTGVRIPEKIADVLAVTLAAQIGVLPVTTIYFNKVSVISLIPNLLAGPLLEFITVLGTLMALAGQFSLFASRALGYLNNIFLSAVLFITREASEPAFATVRTVTPPLLLAAAWYIFVGFMLWYKPLKNIKLKLKHTAVLLSIAAAIAFAGYVRPGRLDVVFLDVGQGDSAFISTCTGKTALIDGGGSTNPEKTSKIGENTVIPFLLDWGINKPDAVIATHPHSDHIQGLESVLEDLGAGMLIIPSMADESDFECLLRKAADKNVPVVRCSTGETIRLDDRTILKVLSPEPGCTAKGDSANNASLVLKLVYGETEILFTGDAESEVEEKLLAESGDISADVLKIAHHGSSTSTGKAFLDKVDPEAAVISVGKNNFGHPSDKTLGLIEQGEISCFRTDECGAVLLSSDGHKIRLKRTVRK